MRKIGLLLNTSIIKTIYFNFHYLGFHGLINPRFLIGKKIVFKNGLHGRINCSSNVSLGGIKIGIYENEISCGRKMIGVWNNKGTVDFDGDCNLGCGIKISVDKQAKLCFGKECSVNGDSEFVVNNYVVIGDNTNISWGCIFIDSDFHSIYNEDNELINYDKPVIIENDVWICARSIILKGAHIKSGCVVGAGSIVTREVEVSNAVITGNNIISCKNIVWKMKKPGVSHNI